MSVNHRGESTSLPGAYARELIELCARWGVDPDALLGGLGDGPGLSVEALSDPSTRLPLSTFEALIERAERLTGEPGLAFFIGLQMRISGHGFLGFAAMTASNVREALDLATRFSRTRTTAISLRTHVEGDTAQVALDLATPGHAALCEFLVIALFVGIRQIGDAVTGQKLQGTVDVTFAEPPYFARFRHVIPGTVRFAQPSNRLLFPAAVLDLPILTADPAAMRLARDQCERELAALGDVARLGERVRTALWSDDGDLRSLEEVARRLHVSSRTLKRKLAEHGTTFSGIVDDVRRHQARLLLEDARLSIDEVAARLGYSDTANFTRAFKRWTGRTPAAFRRR